MPSIKTLLCPVDFSQMSQAVLDYAVFMAQSHKAELKLVHGWINCTASTATRSCT